MTAVIAQAELDEVVSRSGEALPRTAIGGAAAAVADSLRVGDSTLLWATVRQRPGDGRRQMLLATRAQAGGASLAAVAAELASARSWRTASGATVTWIGRARPMTIVARVGTTVTNDLAGVRIAGQAGVLKVHRVVGDGGRELAGLASLEPTGLVPRVLARLEYRRPGQPDGTTLALVTEAIGGQTLDLPLWESLEQAWRSGVADLDPAVRELLLSVRAAVCALHRQLAAGRAPEPPALSARLPEVLADISVLRELLPRAASPAHRLLDRAADRARYLARSGKLARSPAHGDLHLSQVLIDAGAVRFVDLGSAHAASSPADDFAALHRALDCFCLDLQVAAAARHDRGEDEVAHELQERAFAAASDRPIATGETATAIRIAEGWRRRVVATLVQPAGEPADRLLYLARLLHDLRYHAEHGGAYYAALAWWHLSRLTTHAGPEVMP